MAYHFSAGQYDKAFLPKRLGNWEAPHWYPRRPRAPELKGPTVPLADSNGRLLPKARRLAPAWGLRRTAWDYPNRITRQLADELGKDPPAGRYVEWRGNNKKVVEPLPHVDEQEIDDQNKIESERLDFKSDEFQTELEGNVEKLNLNNIDHTLDVSEMNDHYDEHADGPKPIVDPLSGYYYARKMHMDNLLHRPLPDALGSKASNLRHVPGRDLMVKPYSEPGNVSSLVHGPQRPVTSQLNKQIGSIDKKLRPATCLGENGLKLLSKGITPMDLAICWDYRALNPRDEPKRPKHIDGSNGSMAPAVFSMVHSPKVDPHLLPDTGRSNAIFSQNVILDDSEDNRILPSFDKDMSKNRRKNSCDTPKCPQHSYHERNVNNEKHRDKTNGNHKKDNQDKKEKCDGIHGCGTPDSSNSHSTKVSKMMNDIQEKFREKNHWKNDNHTSKENNPPKKDSEKYMLTGRRKSFDDINNNKPIRLTNEKNLLFQSSPNICKGSKGEHNSVSSDTSKSKSKHFPNGRSCTACHDTRKSENDISTKAEYKMAFKAGKPNSSSGSDCKTGDNTSSSTKTVIRIPKMKDPYRKKSYSIPTLAPPFSRWQDASGYPEHWRLASMYQHAYKTPGPKRRPLLPAVYQ